MSAAVMTLAASTDHLLPPSPIRVRVERPTFPALSSVQGASAE